MFEAIEREVNNYKHLFSGPQYFRWILPRQCGATLWLISKAREFAKNGESILYLSSVLGRIEDFRYDHRLPQNVEIKIYREINQKSLDSLRGKRFDRILIDNVIINNNSNREDFISFIKMITANPIIHIDTGGRNRLNACYR